MVPRESSESGELFLFGEFYFCERFHFLLKFPLQKISLLLAEQMHVLEANFITVNIFKPIFEGLNSVGSVIFVRPLLSHISYDYTISQLLLFVAERSGRNVVVREAAVKIFILREFKRVYLGELMPNRSICINHQPHLQLIPNLFGGSRDGSEVSGC